MRQKLRQETSGDGVIILMSSDFSQGQEVKCDIDEKFSFHFQKNYVSANKLFFANF